MDKEMGRLGLELVFLSSALLLCISRKQYQCAGAEEVAQL